MSHREDETTLPPNGARPSLRSRAEAIVKAEAPREQVESLEEATRLIHELRVHQIELELQNDELRRTQTQLATARSRYFDIYDSAPIGYWTTDTEGRILEANLTSASLVGMVRSELQGSLASRFVFREDQDAYYLFIRRLARGRTPSACELRMKRRDGDVFWVLMDAARAIDPEFGDVFRIVLVDVTERRRAEEDRRSLEMRLHQARKMESIGLLAGGVAHELNNALQVIVFATDTALDEGDFDTKVREDLETVLEAAKRTERIVRQLLAFSRQSYLELEPIDLNESLRRLRPTLADILGSDIALRLQPAPDLPRIPVDERSLEQILVNLCANARDAMPNGGSLTLRTRWTPPAPNVPDEAPSVCLSVCDDGIGMPPEVIARIFEPFFTTKVVGAGPGLGLASVYGLVDQHGGRIEVDSEPGRGSTFDIYLPVDARSDSE